MTKLNMPLTESNVIQFDNYRNFEHQITNDLQTVSDGIADLFKEAVTNAAGIGQNESQPFGNLTANEVINEVLNLIDPDSLETILPEGERAVVDAAAQAATSEPLSGVPISEGEAGAINTLAENNATLAETSGIADGTNAVAENTAATGEAAENAANSAANMIKNTVDGFLSG